MHDNKELDKVHKKKIYQRYYMVEFQLFIFVDIVGNVMELKYNFWG